MPKSWYISSENRINEDDTEEVVKHKKFYQSICAEKKPYFFIYNYPSLKCEYDSYIENVENKSQSMFAATFYDLQKKENKTESEERFVKWANDRNPVDLSPSVMNKICWAIEKEFDDLSKMHRDKFDYLMLKSNRSYSKADYYAILDAYDWYKKKISDLAKKMKSGHYDCANENAVGIEQLVQIFSEKCDEICPNRYELCNILVDLCYSGSINKRTGKQLEKRLDKEIVWTICGETIIENLLSKNNHNLYYPKKVSEGGEFECCGAQFVMTKLKVTGGDCE